MSLADPNQLVHAGLIAQQRGAFQRAESCFRQALAVNANHPPALNALAALAIQFNQAAIAIPLLSRATQIEPGNIDYRLNLGSALRMERRWDDALAAAKGAVDIA